MPFGRGKGLSHAATLVDLEWSQRLREAGSWFNGGGASPLGRCLEGDSGVGCRTVTTLSATGRHI